MGYLFDSFEEDLLCGVDEAGRGPLAGPVVALKWMPVERDGIP